MTKMARPAMKAGIATIPNTMDKPQPSDSMKPLSIDPSTEPIRLTPFDQLTPVARLAGRRQRPGR
jgi:hypothetical protein